MGINPVVRSGRHQSINFSAWIAHPARPHTRQHEDLASRPPPHLTPTPTPAERMTDASDAFTHGAYEHALTLWRRCSA